MTKTLMANSLSSTKQTFDSKILPNISIVQANYEHIKGAKNLADANRAIFAFITHQAFVKAYTQKGLLIAALGEQVVGFLRFYHRKADKQTTIYDICVAEDWQDHGIGRQLIGSLIKECQTQGRELILLKCPTHLAANQFYVRHGFTLQAKQSGKKHDLNVWQLRLAEKDKQ